MRDADGTPAAATRDPAVKFPGDPAGPPGPMTRPFEWSPARTRLFRFERNTVVSAAAGSGKTTALVELYLRLLEGLPPEHHGPGGLGPDGRPLEPEEIVVVTFTEKAAQDLTRKIREGLLARLDRAQALPDPAARRTLSARWEEVRARLAVAPIGTIHHYAARLLREYPVEAGVDPGFEVLDEADADALRREAAADVVRDALERRDPALVLLLGHLPLADQKEYPGIESSLVAALARLRGAGTSVEQLRQATRARLAELEAERARLAADLEAAAAALRSVPAAQPFLAAWDALPDAARRLAPDLDDAARQSLLALAPLAKNWRGSGSRHPMRRVLADTLSELPAVYWQQAATPLGDAFLDLLARVAEAYWTRKRQRRALDFDDLEEGAVRLLRRDRESGGTLLTSRPAVVLVDEFQDNNRRQLELVRLLAGDGAGRLRDRALVVVGDPKQSIYRFRGADVSVFRRITELVAGESRITGDPGAAARSGPDGPGAFRGGTDPVAGEAAAGPRVSGEAGRAAEICTAGGTGSAGRAGVGGGSGIASAVGAAPGADPAGGADTTRGTGPLRFTENFRSVPGIITFVNALFARYMGRPDPARPPYEVPFHPETDALEARRPGAGGAGGDAGAARPGGAAGGTRTDERAGRVGAGPAGEPGNAAGGAGCEGGSPAETAPAGNAGAAGVETAARIPGATGDGPGAARVAGPGAGAPGAGVAPAGGAVDAATARPVAGAPGEAGDRGPDAAAAGAVGAAVGGDAGARASGAAAAAVEQGAGPAVELLCLPANEPAEIRRAREAEAVVRRIRQLLAEGVRPGRIAVLVRTLKHAPPLQRGLEAAGVPAYVVKGPGFYGASEVRDVLCLLASLDSPLDDLALAAVLRSPFAGISDDALLLLARPDPAARPRPLHEAFRDGRLAPPVPPLPEADRARLAAFAAWQHELRLRKDRTPLPELIEEALERSGYTAACLTRAGGDQQLANLRKLVEQARAFEARPGRTLRDFVQELERAVSEEPRETAAQVVGESDDVVRLMTIHAAKGLEFDVVVLPGCADQMPNDTGPVVLDEDPETGGLALRPVNPATLETAQTWLVQRLSEARRQKARAEWRRLFYVAVTRARDRLILVGEHQVNADGSPRNEDTWRREVDALLADRPDLEAAGVVRRIRWEELASAEATRPADGPAGPTGEAAGTTEGTTAGAVGPAGAADGAAGGTDGAAGAARGAAGATDAAGGAPEGAVEEVVKRIRWRPARPSRFVHTVTELAEFAACPHRYYLTRRLGLPDAGDPWFDRGDEPQETAGGAGDWPDEDGFDRAPAPSSGPAGLTALDRGSLAHAVLEHVPLGLDGAELASCVRELVRQYAAGLPGGVPGAGRAPGSGSPGAASDLSGPGTASGPLSDAEQDALAARITAFLEEPTGRALGHAWRADPHRVLREYPFVLRLADNGATLIVHGKIDLLWQGDDRGLHLIDYKTARGQGEDAARKYEFQLLTYALAAGRLAGTPVRRAGIVFLLGEPAEPAWLDVGPEVLVSLETHAVALARRLAELDQEARDGEEWPRIARPACERLGCGFAAKCYGSRGTG